MHQGSQKLLPRESLKRFLAGLQIITLLMGVLFPTRTYAVPKAVLMNNPAILAAMAAALRLNKEMEEASKNPHNKQARENVAAAVRGFAAAIALVAGEFRKGTQFHNNDLPQVQALLGGFIDVTAPERFSKFFKKPDPNLIPKLGPEFPDNITPAPLNVAAGTVSTAPTKSGVSANPSLGPDVIPQIVKPEVPAQKPLNLKRFGYDENLKPGALPSVESLTQSSSQSSAAPLNPVGGSDNPIRSEVDRIENTLERGSVWTPDPGSKVLPLPAAGRAPTSGKEKEDVFFDKIGKDPKKEKASPRRKNGLRKNERRSGINPHTLWNHTRTVGSSFLRLAESLFGVPTAFAEAPAPAMGGPGGGQECDCGGGGGGGGGAADFLFGLAAIIAAAAPIASAAIQANADVKIAEINSNTTLKAQEMATENSKYLADNQKKIAMEQAKITQDIAKQNNDGQTQRLDMQLASLEKARVDALKAEKEKREIEKQYQWEKIRLAEQQRKDTLEVARKSVEKNLTVAGLSNGVVSRSSSSGLVVNRTGISKTTGSPSVSDPLGGGLVANNANNAGAAGSAGGKASAGGAASGVAFKKPGNPAADSVRGVKASKLLASLNEKDLDEEEVEGKQQSKSKKKTLSRKKAPLRLVAALQSKNGRGARVTYDPATSRIINELSDTLAREISSGSSRGIRRRAGNPSNDLRQFRREAAVVDAGPEPYWRGVRQIGAGSAQSQRETSGHSPNKGNTPFGVGGYRVPDLNEDTSGTSYFGFGQ